MRDILVMPDLVVTDENIAEQSAELLQHDRRNREALQEGAAVPAEAAGHFARHEAQDAPLACAGAWRGPWCAFRG